MSGYPAFGASNRGLPRGATLNAVYLYPGDWYGTDPTAVQTSTGIGTATVGPFNILILAKCTVESADGRLQYVFVTDPAQDMLSLAAVDMQAGLGIGQVPAQAVQISGGLISLPISVRAPQGQVPLVMRPAAGLRVKDMSAYVSNITVYIQITNMVNLGVNCVQFLAPFTQSTGKFDLNRFFYKAYDPPRGPCPPPGPTPGPQPVPLSYTLWLNASVFVVGDGGFQNISFQPHQFDVNMPVFGVMEITNVTTGAVQYLTTNSVAVPFNASSAGNVLQVVQSGDNSQISIRMDGAGPLFKLTFSGVPTAQTIQGVRPRLILLPDTSLTVPQFVYPVQAPPEPPLPTGICTQAQWWVKQGAVGQIVPIAQAIGPAVTSAFVVTIVYWPYTDAQSRGVYALTKEFNIVPGASAPAIQPAVWITPDPTTGELGLASRGAVDGDKLLLIDPARRTESQLGLGWYMVTGQKEGSEVLNLCALPGAVTTPPAVTPPYLPPGPPAPPTPPIVNSETEAAVLGVLAVVGLAGAAWVFGRT